MLGCVCVIQISQGRRVEMTERHVIDSLMCGFVGGKTEQTQGEMDGWMEGMMMGGGVNLVPPDLFY